MIPATAEFGDGGLFLICLLAAYLIERTIHLFLDPDL